MLLYKKIDIIGIKDQVNPVEDKRA